MTTRPDLESRVRAGLTDLAEDAMALTDTTRELARLEERLQQHRRRPVAWLSAAAAAAAAAVLVLAAALLLPSGDDRAPSVGTRSSAVGTQTQTVAVSALAAEAVQATSDVRVGTGPVVLAARGDELLALPGDPGSSRLVRLDARTGAVLGDLPVRVPAGFGVYEAHALPGGLLVTLLSVDRAADVNTVYVQLDQDGQEVRRTPAQYFGVGNTASVAPDGVWVGTQGNRIGRLQDGRVVDAVALPFTPSAFAVSGEGIWLSDFHNDRLQLVDRSGAVVERLGSSDPLGVLADGDRVVVAEGTGLLLLDRAAGTATRLVAADGASIRPGGRGLTIADGTAYGVFDDGTLLVLPLDAADDATGYALPERGSISAAVAGGRLWLGGGESSPSVGLDPRRL